MSNANFWSVAASLLLGFLGSCAIVISGSSGGIPELAYAGVPMLLLAVALFWRVFRQYPKGPDPGDAGGVNKDDTGRTQQ